MNEKEKKKKPKGHIQFPIEISELLPPVITSATLTKQQQNLMMLEMRRAGWAPSSIAFAMGLTKATVVQRLRKIQRQYARMAYSNQDDIRINETIRLEACWKALYPEMMTGNTRAIEVGMKVHERLAKLWGIETPTRVETNVSGSITHKHQHMTYEQLVEMAQGMGISFEAPVQVDLLPGEEPLALPAPSTLQIPTVEDAEFVSSNTVDHALGPVAPGHTDAGTTGPVQTGPDAVADPDD